MTEDEIPQFLPLTEMPSNGAGTGAGALKSVVATPVAPLALAEADALPMRARELVCKSIDQGIDHVLNELDDLVRQINELREKVKAEGELCKEVVGKHFNLQGEATATAEKIRLRMVYLSNGGEDH